jgi:hypothetical protein
MRLGKAVLAVTALIWICYGAWLFLDPKGLAYAGFAFPHWSVTVEVLAMYGAFELMLGVFTAIALLRPDELLRPALLLWALLYTGLVVGRTYGILAWDGTFAIDTGDRTAAYNAGALFVLELPSAVLCWVALWLTGRSRSAAAAAAGAPGTSHAPPV